MMDICPICPMFCLNNVQLGFILWFYIVAICPTLLSDLLLLRHLDDI
jgi:hypothetical protein